MLNWGNGNEEYKSNIYATAAILPEENVATVPTNKLSIIVVMEILMVYKIYNIMTVTCIPQFQL